MASPNTREDLPFSDPEPIVNHIRQAAATKPGAAKRRCGPSLCRNQNSASIFANKRASAVLW
jgi:hypothetical protein